jgi:hypothetical protein
MDSGWSLAYQLVVAPSNEMISDLASVISSPPNEAIVAS